MNEKILQLEEEIKNLYQKDTEDKNQSFWSVHVKPVIEESKFLANKYHANKEIVWLSAILHDIGQLDALEPHEVIGSEKAAHILSGKKFDPEIIKRVCETILSHRVNQYVPETLEQKVLASADAISHFKNSHYLWMSKVYKNNFLDLIDKINSKIERDYNEKIFFEEEKKKVEPYFRVLKDWLVMYKINK